MKQTKLREPILYTSLWVVSTITIFFVWGINDTEIMRLDFVIAFILFVILTYCSLWWIYCLTKRADWNDTRDMKKHILWKIKDIDEEMNELQAEREELLFHIKD